MHELLASNVEVVSVSAADKRLREPIQIPRPKPPRKRRERVNAAPDAERGEMSMADAMKKFAAEGKVRKVKRGPSGG